MTDKSREQSEAWFSSEHSEVQNSNELSAKCMKMIARSAWQASRAAIEIELPDVEKWRSVDSVRAQNAYKISTTKSIESAGLKVKK